MKIEVKRVNKIKEAKIKVEVVVNFGISWEGVKI